MEFLPLVPREAQARLQVGSNELGIYQYDLKLVSTPAGPERSLHFKVGLGASQVQTVRFVSFAKQKTEYTCKIDCGEFTVDKSVNAPGGSRFILICSNYNWS